MPGFAACSPCLARCRRPERRIVTSGTGQEVAAQGDAIPQPVMAVVSPVYDSGAIIGNVEIQRSLQELLVITAIITALAGSFGAATFAVLRIMAIATAESRAGAIDASRDA